MQHRRPDVIRLVFPITDFVFPTSTTLTLLCAQIGMSKLLRLTPIYAEATIRPPSCAQAHSNCPAFFSTNTILIVALLVLDTIVAQGIAIIQTLSFPFKEPIAKSDRCLSQGTELSQPHPPAVFNLSTWPTSGQADLYGLYVLTDPSYPHALCVPFTDLRLHTSRVPACISYLEGLDHV